MPDLPRAHVGPGREGKLQISSGRAGVVVGHRLLRLQSTGRGAAAAGRALNASAPSPHRRCRLLSLRQLRATRVTFRHEQIALSASTRHLLPMRYKVWRSRGPLPLAATQHRQLRPYEMGVRTDIVQTLLHFTRGGQMKRREILKAIGSVVASWSLPTHAQQTARIPRVGVLWHARSAEEEGSNYRALIKGFKDLGYVEGRNIVLEHRFPGDLPANFRSMAADLVASGVDVLVSIGANAAPYARDATKTIPVVFAVVPDPVGSKLVKSLAQPEANVTGLSNTAADLIGKRLELFKEVIPGLARVALLVNANSQLASTYINTTQTGAAALALSCQVF